MRRKERKREGVRAREIKKRTKSEGGKVGEREKNKYMRVRYQIRKGEREREKGKL